MLISVVLAAILGVPDSATHWTAPVPVAVVVQDSSPVGSGSVGAALEIHLPRLDAVRVASSVPRRVGQVDAQLLEKYRAFRESLSAP